MPFGAPIPILTKGQGKGVATLITSGVDIDVGRANKGLPRQIFPT